MAQPTKVFHIPGRFTHEAPNQDHSVESKAEAERLVATGAFALSAKEANEQAFTTAEATPATDANVKQPRPPEEPAPEPAPVQPEE